MKLDDVLKLKEAGFTAEEIATLAPSIKEDVSIIKNSESSAQTKVESPDLSGLNAKIDALTEQMQKLAVQSSSMTPPADNNLQDIVKNVLGGK